MCGCNHYHLDYQGAHLVENCFVVFSVNMKEISFLKKILLQFSSILARLFLKVFCKDRRIFVY